MPAALAVLACMNAVGEALTENRNALEAFRAFYEAMEDKTSWIAPPEGMVMEDAAVVQHLVDTRHDLVHALCLPLDVELVQDRQWQKSPDHWGLYLLELIDEVEKTVGAITQNNPDLHWDPTNRRKNRGPVGLVPVRRRNEFSPVTTAYNTLGEESSCGSIATSDERVDENHF
jgi:hypothetical protein